MPVNSPIGAPGTVFLEVETDSEAMYGVTLALCTCSLALGKEAGDVDHGEPNFAIMPATAIGIFENHYHGILSLAFHILVHGRTCMCRMLVLALPLTMSPTFGPSGPLPRGTV